MGVPAGTLTGLEAYGIDPEGCVMGLLANGGNLDNTVKLMQWLIGQQCGDSLSGALLWKCSAFLCCGH